MVIHRRIETNRAKELRSQRQHFAAPGGSHDRLVTWLGKALPMAVGVIAALMVITPLSPGTEVSFLLDRNKVALINDMEPETFTDVMDANVTQRWLVARAAAGQMKAQGKGGKIVLVSSARGLLGHPAGYTAYCASKAAVDGMTKALGCELGPTGITVNAIAPTVFRSPLTAWMFEDTPEATTIRNGFLARVPKSRLGEPEDLAGPLLFLSSKASDFYTGHILYADGGYTAG